MKHRWTGLLLVLQLSLCLAGCNPCEEQGQTVRSGGAAESSPPRVTDLVENDYESHLEDLQKKLPGRDFTVVVQIPFVVIGDEAPQVVWRRAEKTVKWACDRLKAKFFEKNPAAIYDIWLFRDDNSYRKHTFEIFGDEPDTPFGYSSSRHKALIMNISTGGGTLVHEIVHPFVAANFPDCPAWFNEGLGSLYEQCTDRDGEIWGLTNWRLAGLQREIGAGNVPAFEKLLAATDQEFYNEDPGTNYAQSRYLCYYLQEKGLLPQFYRAFLANSRDDPTGFATLKEILHRPDMASFQREWEKYVLDLRFP